MTRPGHAERDPLPARTWEPTSREYRRREALQATVEAVRASREKRKKPAGTTEEIA